MFTAAIINQKDKITQIPSKRNMEKKKTQSSKRLGLNRNKYLNAQTVEKSEPET